MLHGETMYSGADAGTCENCGGKEWPLQVMKTCAWYVGTACKGCGMPNSRETDYYDTKEEAERVLAELQRGQVEATRAFKAGELPGVPDGI